MCSRLYSANPIHYSLEINSGVIMNQITNESQLGALDGYTASLSLVIYQI